MSTRIFPRRDSEFNDYVNTAIPYLDTNKARLGVSNAHINAAKDLLTNPAGTSGWNQVFPLQQNPATRTSDLTAQKDALREQLEDLLRIIYNDIPQSALTSTDRLTLHLKERDHTPTPRPAITTAPFVDLKVGDGATVQVTCRVESDSSRASRHPDADAIEMAYSIGGSMPPGPESMAKTTVFTHAIHDMHFSIDQDAGKTLWCALRWKNTSDDTKSGPWSQVMNIVISN